MGREGVSLVSKVSRYLDERGVRAYLVGGFVRDGLLGRPTADIDIAIDADAIAAGQKMAADLAGTFVLLDADNRIGRVVFPGEGFGKAGHPWYVDISTLAGDIHQDLARRDFTVDALAIELVRGIDDPFALPLIDPFDGRGDLARQSLKATGDSVFQADPLRLLRAVRLAAELGLHISSETEAWIRRDYRLISLPAGERIREELLKILVLRPAGRFVRRLDDLRLLTAIIPELEAARAVEQPVEHHWDVLNHSLETVRAIDFLLRQDEWEYGSHDLLETVPWSQKFDSYFAEEVGANCTRAALLRLACLLHDIAKPATKIIANDRVRFFGHTDQGADLVAPILERLRFSKREIKLVETMVRLHMRPTQLSQTGTPTPRAIYRYFRDAGAAAVDVLFLSLADHLAARGPDLSPQDWRWHADQTACLLTACFKEEILAPPRLIDGYDLMQIFGLKPGPSLGRILDAVKEAQAAGEITSRDEALSYVKNRLL